MKDKAFADRLRSQREKARLSRLDVSFALRRLPKTMWASPEKIRRMEAGEVAEDAVDPVFLASLAAIYNCEISQLSTVAAKDAVRLAGLLVHMTQPCDSPRIDKMSQGGGRHDRRHSRAA